MTTDRGRENHMTIVGWMQSHDHRQGQMESYDHRQGFMESYDHRQEWMDSHDHRQEWMESHDYRQGWIDFYSWRIAGALYSVDLPTLYFLEMFLYHATGFHTRTNLNKDQFSFQLSPNMIKFHQKKMLPFACCYAWDLQRCCRVCRKQSRKCHSFLFPFN